MAVTTIFNQSNSFSLILALICLMSLKISLGRDFVVEPDEEIDASSLVSLLKTFELVSLSTDADRVKGDTDQLKYNVLLLTNPDFGEQDSENDGDDVDGSGEKIKSVKEGEVIVDLENEVPFSAPTYRAAFISPKFSEKYFDGADIVCLKKGTPVELSPYYYEGFVGHFEEDAEDFYEWYNDKCLRVEFGMVNFHTAPLNAFWISPNDGEKVPQGTIEIGEPNTFWRTSYLGHVFRVESTVENDGFKPIEYNVDCDAINVIGVQETQKGQRVSPTKTELEAIHTYEMSRAARIKRVFTDKGYQKIPIPKRLWASIRTFWHNNRKENNLFEEIWKGRSVYVNWWDVVPKMSVVPFGLKAAWHEMFQPILEDWAQVELEPTDLYGIRVYYNGSWLLDHVDRHETHAVSAIINVEQGGLKEDWELEIYAINGTVVHSDLQQGEAMLYESAKAMHGRPKPLNGDYYANVFFHYKPADSDDTKWWLNEGDVEEETAEKDEL